jgi:lipoyl-dependent peroxiredoxin
MPIRRSSAIWEGSFREGKGQMRVGNGIFEGPYSAASRFENGPGTNPEELIGAAHAGCFSMALALVLSMQKTPPKRIETTADVKIEPDGGGFSITSIALQTAADVPGVSEADFQKAAETAKVGCPVSKALKAVSITLEAHLLKS